MWTKGKEATTEQMNNAAAAILAQTKPTARQGVQILEGARSDAKTDTTKTDLGIALLTGYSNLQEYEKLYALASEMAKQSPESKRLFFDQEIALRALHRYEEADALAQEMGKRLPDDTDIRRAFIYTAVAREDYARAHELGRKLVEDGKAEGQDLNGVAWNALFTGKVSQEDLEAATKSAQVTQNSSAGILHTLGCVYAEMGKTKEAREVLVQAIDLLGMDDLDANYWYGFGRIAEQYGETEAASADYEKAKKPKDDLQVPGSSYALAQKRLAAMKSAKQ
jgi:tetratricopeptide (TPR) repeat protein